MRVKCYYFQTLAMSYLTAFASAFYEVEIIFIVVGLVGLITFGISMLATFAKVL